MIEEVEKINAQFKETSDEFEAESVDPRVQIELERLNKASSDINKIENELEEAKNIFHNCKNRQLQRLEFLQKKLGSCIAKSKPYYEALKLNEKLQEDAQKAVQEYQRANSLYKTAKETLSVAETNLSSGEIPDAWQEHLSTTISKINSSKKFVDQAEDYHRRKTSEYQASEENCLFLEKELKRHIVKSQSYYEEKTRWNVQMEAQKSRIEDLEKTLTLTKITYKDAMLSLSRISEEIHNRRKIEKTMKNLPPRESGVGAENPSQFMDSMEPKSENLNVEN